MNVSNPDRVRRSTAKRDVSTHGEISALLTRTVLHVETTPRVFVIDNLGDGISAFCEVVTDHRGGGRQLAKAQYR